MLWYSNTLGNRNILVQLSLNKKKEGTKYKSTELSLFDGMRHLRLSIGGGRSSSSCRSLLIRVSHDISLVEQLGNREKLKLFKSYDQKCMQHKGKKEKNGKKIKKRKRHANERRHCKHCFADFYYSFCEGTKVRRQRGNN